MRKNTKRQPNNRNCYTVQFDNIHAREFEDLIRFSNFTYSDALRLIIYPRLDEFTVYLQKAGGDVAREFLFGQNIPIHMGDDSHVAPLQTRLDECWSFEQNT